MQSSYPFLKLFTILFPPVIIGLAEVIRHEFLLDVLSMEAGNVLITLIVFLMSYAYAVWMFGRIEASKSRLSVEETRRAVYEERERLAGELHDNIAQALFFLNVKLQKGQTEEARSAAAEINSHLRQAIFNLRSHPEEGDSFTARVRQWIEEWSVVSGMICETEIAVPENCFSTNEEIQLFGLIQEAFTNIRKHSEADRTAFSLAGDRTHWKLMIMDNGVGVPEHALKAPHGGMTGRYGLSMMSKRAGAVGAYFHLERLQPVGTAVIVEKRKGEKQL